MKKAKRIVLRELDLNNVTDTNIFWKTVKSVFGNKLKTCNTTTLIKKSTVITSEKVLAKMFDELFVNIVPNLGIGTYTCMHRDGYSFWKRLVKKLSHLSCTRKVGSEENFQISDVSHSQSLTPPLETT